MRASRVLQKCLSRSFPGMHALRERSLLRAVEALLHGRRFTLIDIARSWPGATRVHAPLKAFDRLLGNRHLQAERTAIDHDMARWLLRGPRPVIVIDWSDLKPWGKRCQGQFERAGGRPADRTAMKWETKRGQVFLGKMTSSTGSYTVSWGSVSTATSYTLQESSNGGSSWSTAYTGSATSKALSGKGNGTYTYRVEACNAGGCGAWSATHAIKVALIPAEPAQISAPTQVPYPGNAWPVSWSAVSGATRYVLRRTFVGTTSVNTIYSGSGTSAVDLTTPGTYLYAVQACNAIGCSGWRSASSNTTVFCAEMAASPETVQPNIGKCVDLMTTQREDQP